ncbi:hypothetical protein ScPMuIL_010860 [Solemya velum]
MPRKLLKRYEHKKRKFNDFGSDQKTDVKLKTKKLPLGSKEKDDNERLLETLVLGGEEDLVKSLGEITEKKPREEIKKKKSGRPSKQPVWKDTEDEDEYFFDPSKVTSKNSQYNRKEGVRLNAEEYAERLKTEFEKVTATPKWAKLPSERVSDSEDDSDDDDLLRRTGNNLVSSTTLPRGILQIKQCADANKAAPSKGKLKSVEFHPFAQALLTAGMDQTLNLFQVDGKYNANIQTVFIENYPIHTAHFSCDGQEVIMGSKHKSFHYYDMIAGKLLTVPKIKGLEENCMKKFNVSPDGRYLIFLGSHGNMHLLTAKSKEWIATLKMNGSVESVALTEDGSKMYSYGDDGDVYIWDMGTRDCVHRFTDEGCVHGTSIGVSQNRRYLACGSYSGIVNVYDTDICSQSQNPKPLKAIMNLTSPCTSSLFNSHNEILALSSNYSERAIKLVHFPSMSVFSNFPDKYDTKLRIPVCMDFSKNSGYFCVGTHKGNALLYRVKHYGDS